MAVEQQLLTSSIPNHAASARPNPPMKEGNHWFDRGKKKLARRLLINRTNQKMGAQGRSPLEVA